MADKVFFKQPIFFVLQLFLHLLPIYINLEYYITRAFVLYDINNKKLIKKNRLVVLFLKSYFINTVM